MPSGVAALFRAVITGTDFEPSNRMLEDLTEEQASFVIEGAPYSIAKLVAHLCWWQDLSLERLEGKGGLQKFSMDEQWPEAPYGRWKDLVRHYLDGESRALAFAETIDLDALAPTGETNETVLQRLVLHNIYHLGQIALLRQVRGLWPVAGGDDLW